MTLPPFPNGHAPGLECSRWMSDRHCGKPATWHIIWTPAGENGLCCNTHMDEARHTWSFLAAHPYDPICSVAGAVFVHAENHCVVTDLYESGVGEREATGTT